MAVPGGDRLGIRARRSDDWRSVHLPPPRSSDYRLGVERGYGRLRKRRTKLRIAASNLRDDATSGDGACSGRRYRSKPPRESVIDILDTSAVYVT